MNRPKHSKGFRRYLRKQKANLRRTAATRGDATAQVQTLMHRHPLRTPSQRQSA